MATLVEIEKLGRLLAQCDPEGAPYDSPTGNEADGNAGYWNAFAERLLAKRAERFDGDGVWEALVEFSLLHDDNPLADNTAAYDHTVARIGECFI